MPKLILNLYLTDEEITLLLEVARIALHHKQTFERIADECDVQDDELDALAFKVDRICDKVEA
jgi:hypothetical protein